MPLNLNTTGITPVEITIGQCKIIDLGTGVAPTTVTVELPDSDGARVATRWIGFPSINVNDFVRIQRRTDDTIFEIISTSAGTATPRIRSQVTTVTTTYTITSTDDLILADASGGAFTITLPTAVGIIGREYEIKKIDTSINAITIDADGSETIDRALTFDLELVDEVITIKTDGSNWFIT